MEGLKNSRLSSEAERTIESPLCISPQHFSLLLVLLVLAFCCFYCRPAALDLYRLAILDLILKAFIAF